MNINVCFLSLAIISDIELINSVKCTYMGMAEEAVGMFVTDIKGRYMCVVLREIKASCMRRLSVSAEHNCAKLYRPIHA